MAFHPRGTAARRGGGLRLALFLLLALVAAPVAVAADLPDDDAPLQVGGRTVHVFRVPLGALTPADRAATAERHIAEAFERDGEGWTSIAPRDGAILVALDGKPLFAVLPGDARAELGETPESLANEASRVLQRAWAEHRESRDPRAGLRSLAIAIAALAAMVAGLLLVARFARWLHDAVRRRLSERIGASVPQGVGAHFATSLLHALAGIAAAGAWIAGLAFAVAMAGLALSQFPATRPAAEQLGGSIAAAVMDALVGAADAVPGLVVAILIFGAARLATGASRGLFDAVAAGRLRLGAIDADTAPTTRKLVAVAIWLFALAMAYPYLPGSQTEAFKGLSLLLGVMVSIGASGLVGQLAAGLTLAYTHSLRVGEHVKVGDAEGTVLHLGMFVTRLRTPNGSEASIPNALLAGQPTFNLSRGGDAGPVVETTIGIGYDVPWRQVQALLLAAARQVPSIRQLPAPEVVPTALGDFAIQYRLQARLAPKAARPRLFVLGELHAAILDEFNRAGVQIMSPAYVADPATAKLVPEADWFKPPARE